MPFDITTARPIVKSGFDISSARPIESSPVKLRDIQTGPRNIPEALAATFEPVRKAGEIVARGVIEPPAKLFGQAGLGIESMISKKPPLEYNVPFPKIFGGSIPIKAPKTILQALGPAVETGLLTLPLTAKPALKLAGKITKPALKLPMKAISKVRDYAGNKIEAIRPAMKSVYKKEMNAYGEAISSMAKNPKDIDAFPLLEKTTQKMVERNLYDPLNSKWVKPLNRVDSQFVKSYETIFRKYKSNKKVAIGDVVSEYQKIRDSAPIDTSMGRDARKLASDFIHNLGDQIDDDVFKAANSRYAKFKNEFDAIDKSIDIWGSNIETGKGEKFLTRGIGETRESRRIGQTITKRTGQTLKGAKLLSTLKNLPIIRPSLGLNR